MRAEVAVEVLVVAGAFRASKAGCNAVEEPRGSTSDFLRGGVAGYTTGLSHLCPRRLAPLGSSTALRPPYRLRSAQNDFGEK